MPIELDPSGNPVSSEGVRITSPGLEGRVTVRFPDAGDARVGHDSMPDLAAALRNANLREQLTVEIVDPVEHPQAGVAGVRSTTTGEPAIAVEVPGPGTGQGQLLLAADEDGVVSWHWAVTEERASTLRSDKRRTYTIPRRVVPPPAAATRGVVGALGKKILKIFVFDLVDRVAGAVGSFFVKRWEAKQRPHRLCGLRLDDNGASTWQPLESAQLAALGTGRSLLLIHGTASTTESAFARLPAPLLRTLNARYDGRVVAFDHPTIATDPTANARWLGETLEAVGVSLDADVIAHSRGGLVARVIAAQPAAAQIDPVRLRIGTAVLVGTPNAGTALADFENVGALVDRLTNLLTLVPDNPITDTLDVLISLLKQVAVGALEGLDGLASMQPEGEYLTGFLNTASAVRTTAYRAVAADFEPADGSPLARLARDGVADLLFGGQANDLVVPTDGVHAKNGGCGFPIADPLLFAADRGVDHSGFWVEPELEAALDQWLRG